MNLNLLKKFVFSLTLATLTYSSIAQFFQMPVHAEVNRKLLSSLIKSCKEDMNFDYYKKMGISKTGYSSYLYLNLFEKKLEPCITRRYQHLSLVELLPWLPSSGEIIPGYSASVAVSIMSFLYDSNRDDELLLQCLSDVNPESSNCSSLNRITPSGKYRGYDIFDSIPFYLPLVCPKCVVAYDDSSEIEIKRGFITWFLSLDKPKRRQVFSLISSKGRTQIDKINGNASLAIELYRDALKKVEQDEKEQRKRNLLGQ